MRKTVQQIKLLVDYGTLKEGSILQRGSEKDRKTHNYDPKELFWYVESDRMDNQFLLSSWIQEKDYVVLEEDFV